MLVGEHQLGWELSVCLRLLHLQLGETGCVG